MNKIRVKIIIISNNDGGGWVRKEEIEERINEFIQENEVWNIITINTVCYHSSLAVYIYYRGNE